MITANGEKNKTKSHFSPGLFSFCVCTLGLGGLTDWSGVIWGCLKAFDLKCAVIWWVHKVSKIFNQLTYGMVVFFTVRQTVVNVCRLLLLCFSTIRSNNKKIKLITYFVLKRESMFKIERTLKMQLKTFFRGTDYKECDLDMKRKVHSYRYKKTLCPVVPLNNLYYSDCRLV